MSSFWRHAGSLLLPATLSVPVARAIFKKSRFGEDGEDSFLSETVEDGGDSLLSETVEDDKMNLSFHSPSRNAIQKSPTTIKIANAGRRLPRLFLEKFFTFILGILLVVVRSALCCTMHDEMMDEPCRIELIGEMGATARRD